MKCAVGLALGTSGGYPKRGGGWQTMARRYRVQFGYRKVFFDAMADAIDYAWGLASQGIHAIVSDEETGIETHRTQMTPKKFLTLQESCKGNRPWAKGGKS